MKQRIVFLASAVIVLSGLLFVKAYVTNKTDSMSLFEINVEALAEEEQAPGEAENCEVSDEHCYYSYGGKHYNIERRANKR